MKCIDTPLLLDLLLGRPSARRWLKGASVTEGELATTEYNMTELALEAHSQKGSPLHRVAALENLRRELTVLPVDRESYRTLSVLLRKNPGRTANLPGTLVAATALAHGSTHLWTDKKRALPALLGPLKVQRY